MRHSRHEVQQLDSWLVGQKFDSRVNEANASGERRLKANAGTTYLPEILTFSKLTLLN